MMKFIKTIYSWIIFFVRYRRVVLSNSELRNTGTGRIFCLGSGPSMKNVDLNILNDENCILLNSFIDHPDYDTVKISFYDEKISRYYLIAPIHPPQTEQVWTDWLLRIDQNVPDHFIMVLGINAKSMNLKNLVDKHGIFSRKKVYYFFAGNYVSNVTKSRINLLSNVIGSETVSLYSIYFALFMGYDEIGLLGMDHSYLMYTSTSEMRMFEAADHQKSEQSLSFAQENMYLEYLRQYKIFKKYSQLQVLFPNKIFNYTKGGLLNIFVRKNIDDLAMNDSVDQKKK